MKSTNPNFAILYHTLILLLLWSALSGCRRDPLDVPTVSPPTPTPEQEVTIPPVLTLLPKPEKISSTRDPLGDDLASYPALYIVSNRMDQKTLAAHLKTTPEQLSRLNPGLPIDITPGEIVAVAPELYIEEQTTMTNVAQMTGLPVAQLRAANPDIAPDWVLTDTHLALPALYFVDDPVPLADVADLLDADIRSLNAANPGLPETEFLSAGTVLIRPVEDDSTTAD